MQKIVSGILVFFLLLTGCSKSPQDQVEELNEVGLSQVAAFDFSAARESFEAIRQIDSISTVSQYGLALVDEAEGKWFDAIRVYGEIAADQPDFLPAHTGLVRCLMLVNMPEKALQAAIRLSALAGDDLQIRLTIVDILLANAMYEQAAEELDRLMAQQDTGELNLARARLLYLENKVDSAAVLMSASLATPGDNLLFYQEAARCLEVAGQLDSSMAMSRKAWSLDSTDHRVLIDHFIRSIRTGHDFDGQSVIRYARASATSEYLPFKLEWLFHRPVIPAGPYRLAGNNLRGLDPLGVSTTVFDIEAMSTGVDDLNLMTDLALLEKILVDGGFRSEFLVLVRTYIFNVFVKSDMQTLITKQLELLGPEFVAPEDLRFVDACLKNLQGQSEAFDEAMDVITASGKDDAAYQTRIGDAYGGPFNNRFEKAEKHYKAALKLDKWYRPAFDRLITMLKRQERYSDALKTYQQYTDLVERYPLLMAQEAVLMVRNDQIENGLALLAKSVGAVRGRTRLFKQVIQLLEGKGKLDERRQVMNLMLELTPHNHHALLLASDIENDDGDFARAQQLANTVVTANPDDLGGRARLALAFYNLGDRERAFDLFDSVLIAKKRQVEANYYYSRILAAEKIDLRRAENMARRALYRSDRDVKYQINLSYVYYQSERYKLSKAEAQKVARKFPQLPQPFFRLGMAQHMMKNDAAGKNLQRAIDLGLRGDDLIVAKETLAKL